MIHRWVNPFNYAISVDPDETAHKSRLIKIYTVCYPVNDFDYVPLSPCKIDIVNFRKSGMKEFMLWLA